MREATSQLQRELDQNKRKAAMLRNTLLATMALTQEAAQQRAQLLLEIQLCASLLKQLHAKGVQGAEVSPVAPSATAASLSPQFVEVIDVLAQDMLHGSSLPAHVGAPENPPKTTSQPPSQPQLDRRSFTRQPIDELSLSLPSRDNFAEGLLACVEERDSAGPTGKAREKTRRFSACD